MKSPAYTPDLLLENCDQTVLYTANHRRLAFLFSTNLKDALRFWNLQQAIFIGKKIGAIISLVVIRCTFVFEHV